MSPTVVQHLPYHVKFQGTPSLRVPPGAVAAPKEVAAAAKVVDARREAHAAASAEWRDAKEKLRHAPQLDKAAAAAAAASGEELPALVEPRAKAAFEAAERELTARRSALNAAVVELANQIREHLPGWLAKQEDAVEALRETARARLGELGEALDALGDERAILAGLQDWPMEGSLGGLELVPSGRRRAAHAEAVAALTQEVDR